MRPLILLIMVALTSCETVKRDYETDTLTVQCIGACSLIHRDDRAAEREFKTESEPDDSEGK